MLYSLTLLHYLWFNLTVIKRTLQTKHIASLIEPFSERFGNLAGRIFLLLVSSLWLGLLLDQSYPLLFRIVSPVHLLYVC